MIDLLITRHQRCLIAADMMASDYNRDDLILNNLDLINQDSGAYLEIVELAAAVQAVAMHGVPMVNCCEEYWPMPNELVWTYGNAKTGQQESHHRPLRWCSSCLKFVAAEFYLPTRNGYFHEDD